MMKKMSAVGVAAVMIASQTMAGDAVQWRVEDGGNGHWYEVSNLGPTMTGDSARQHAADRGGYLLSITSLEEDNFVQTIVTDLNAWGNEFLGPMIGMHRDGGDCWNGCWDSGEVVGYTHWHPGNPDGSLERCVYLYRYGVCEWQDYACDLPGWGSRAVSAVVEWSADCNNDGIVDYGQCQDGTLVDYNSNNIPDTCECIGDIYVDGIINGGDLGVLLAYWGPTTSAVASIACDLNVDGVINGSDLGILLASWGPCKP